MNDRRAAWLFAIPGLSLLAITFAIVCDWQVAIIQRQQRTIETVSRELRWKSYALIKAETKIAELPKARFLISTMRARDPYFCVIAESAWKYGKYLERWKQIESGPELVMALIHRESNFDPFAQSYRIVYDVDGEAQRIPIAHGPAQINFKVWQKSFGLDPRMLFNPDYNIKHAVKIFDRYMERCGGNISCALFKYYGGDPERHGMGYPERVLGSKYFGGSR